MMTLKKLREAAGLTQKEVAEKLGISDNAYQRYEYGNAEPRVTLAIKITKIFGVTVEELYGDKK